MSMLVYYDIIGKVIQKILQKVFEKMENNQQLTEGDQITIYESSLTFFTIIQQQNNFKFSELDALRSFYNQTRKDDEKYSNRSEKKNLKF